MIKLKISIQASSTYHTSRAFIKVTDDRRLDPIKHNWQGLKVCQKASRIHVLYPKQITQKHNVTPNNFGMGTSTKQLVWQCIH